MPLIHAACRRIAIAAAVAGWWLLMASEAWAKAAAGTIREPEEVAQMVVDAIDEERFLVLTDPIAQEWMEGKTADPDRWLRGMNRLQQRIEEAEGTRA